MSIRISLMSIPVDDQAKALDFYTNTLGFETKHDRAMGGPYRWLTVTSPAGPEGVELLLEPNAHPATQAHQSALYADGIPHAQFFVDDIEAVYDRLRARGVRFKGPPARMGDAKAAIFDDTCGNWIILTQELPIEDAASE